MPLPTIQNRHPLSLWLLLLILTILTLLQLHRVFAVWSENNLLENPEKITQEDSALSANLAFAKAWHLNQQGDFQEALRLYNQIENTSNPQLLENVRYNMGVIYLQQAAKHWKVKGVFEYKQINTLLDLAEQAFRQVLLDNPEHWQARYNLETALRIRPPAKQQDEADWQGHKTSVQAIMPGIPSGGP